MKFIAFILLIIDISTTFVCAGTGNDGVEFFIVPSRISKAKVDLLQEFGKHLDFFNYNIVYSKTYWDDDQAPVYKDRKTAFFRSLLVPGAGQKYLGQKGAAKGFFIAEISLWISFFAFKEYGKWVRQDALAFAATHSGAITQGKPSQFFVDIGNYRDVYEYNDNKQRMYQFDKVYTSEDYFWAWDDNSNRQKFEQMRIDSDKAINRSTFVLGGIFANHIISAIHAVWQTHRYNKQIEQTHRSGLNFYVNSNAVKGEISFNIQKEF